MPQQHEVRTLLARQGWPHAIESARERGPDRWAPWLSPHSLRRPGHDGGTLPGLLDLLHLGRSSETAALGAELANGLGHAGLIRSPDASGVVRPTWRITAFGGILAAAGRAYGEFADDVYLGSDGLRFTAAVLAAQPSGHVLDVGCGSGIASAAAARTATTVTAFDAVAGAVEATACTARLNGAETVIRGEVADVADRPFDDADVVIANLPGLPVPDDVRYPVAGNGGADGLSLIRSCWRSYAATLRGGGPRRLIMRFESAGTSQRPAALGELAELFADHCDVLVVTDSRVPLSVRNSVTARNATALNPEVSAADLDARLNRATAGTGATHFHSSTAYVDFPGGGALRHVVGAPALTVDRAYRPRAGPPEQDVVLRDYLFGLAGMPDEFWSVGGESEVITVVGRIAEVVSALGDGCTPAEIAAGTTGDRLAAELSAALVADVLIAAGHLLPAD